VDEQRDSLILIVEDDEATKGFLADNLAADGFRVAWALMDHATNHEGEGAALWVGVVQERPSRVRRFGLLL
jgi:hypothetical protein